MNLKKKCISILIFTVSISVFSKDYKASLFGIKSNGTTLNTRSIQYAIDFIHKNGGGRLVFYVGRYLTGSIHLKSNVTIHLEEGAVILGSTNPFDYDSQKGWTGLILAIDQKNIGITGKGIIDGQGFKTAYNYANMIHKGLIKDPLKYDRPGEIRRPQNILFRECSHIQIRGITFRNPGSWNQTYDQCKNVIIDGIRVDSKSFWNNDGVDIVDCDSVSITNSFFDAADDTICFKSHDSTQICQNVVVRNNIARSSASGIKFGTASFGGFRNFKIVNNMVYDTYRSAINMAAVDGGFIENILIDSLRAVNTANIIFINIGKRRKNRKAGIIKDILISNVYAEVPLGKPDAGYNYEGPVEDMPRNVSPCVITGKPGALIQNITLKNIEIHYPGAGNPLFAKVGLDELDKVPELAGNYPEFSMYKELPAWGFYVRHVKGIVFENVTLIADKKDYRTAIVLDDVNNGIFKNLEVTDPEKEKKPIFQYKSKNIKIID